MKIWIQHIKSRVMAMKNKKCKILILLLVIACFVLGSVSVYATEPSTDDFIVDGGGTGSSTESGSGSTTDPDDDFEADDDFEPESEESSTTASGSGDSKNPTQTQNGTTNDSSGSKNDYDEDDETEQQVRPQQRPQQNQNITQNRPVDVTEQVTVATTVSKPSTTKLNIPEGMYVIWFEFNDGSERKPSTPASEPELITKPADPQRKGFLFDGWYKDSEFKELWNFNADFAQEGTVLYAKWVPDPNAVVFNITVRQAPGGKVEVNPSAASPGEPVRINVTPDDGMRIVPGSVTINGERTDILSFTMPYGDVVVAVRFEAMPEKEQTEEKESVIPYVIGAVAVVAIIVTIAVIFIKARKDDFAEDEIDENGTIIEKDDDRSWVDETIVVNDGFKDGEKVIGEYTPGDETDVFFDEE